MQIANVYVKEKSKEHYTFEDTDVYLTTLKLFRIVFPSIVISDF